MIRNALMTSAAALLLTTAAPAAAPPYETSARIAYLVDLSSGAVLFDKGSNERMPPASMAKMMTSDVAFELIDKGQPQIGRAHV